jgi:hypothetical protein
MDLWRYPSGYERNQKASLTWPQQDRALLFGRQLGFTTKNMRRFNFGIYATRALYQTFDMAEWQSCCGVTRRLLLIIHDYAHSNCTNKQKKLQLFYQHFDRLSSRPHHRVA